MPFFLNKVTVQSDIKKTRWFFLRLVKDRNCFSRCEFILLPMYVPIYYRTMLFCVTLRTRPLKERYLCVLKTIELIVIPVGNQEYLNRIDT